MVCGIAIYRFIDLLRNFHCRRMSHSSQPWYCLFIWFTKKSIRPIRHSSTRVTDISFQAHWCRTLGGGMYFHAGKLWQIIRQNRIDFSSRVYHQPINKPAFCISQRVMKNECLFVMMGAGEAYTARHVLIFWWFSGRQNFNIILITYFKCIAMAVPNGYTSALTTADRMCCNKNGRYAYYPCAHMKTWTVSMRPVAMRLNVQLSTCFSSIFRLIENWFQTISESETNLRKIRVSRTLHQHPWQYVNTLSFILLSVETSEWQRRTVRIKTLIEKFYRSFFP